MGCEWQEVIERYWGWCKKWGIPYPCRKSRTTRKWCCEFSWLKETGWGLFCTLEGCAAGRRYSWTAFCFNVWGGRSYYNIRTCFSSAKTASGSCT
jgi:hypothetical protein